MLLLLVAMGFRASAQYGCKDSLINITNAYNNGDWTEAKNIATNFLTAMRSGGVTYKDGDYCKNNINQFYNYLIQSYLRLYNIDSASFYYFDAMKNEIKIDLDPEDEMIFKRLATLRKHSINFYEGVISTDFREIKFAVSYGFTPRLFLETSFNQRHFNQSTDSDYGVMGKAMKKDLNKYPWYRLNLQGYDRYMEMAAFIKTPVFKNQKDVNVFYISLGAFATYYLNSYIDTWQLNRYHVGSEDQAYFGQIKNSRYTLADTLGINMNLKKLYANRFNFGFFANAGSSIRLRKNWELFFELKVAVGKNNRYAYSEFNTFRPGVDYFFIVFGATKKLYSLKKR